MNFEYSGKVLKEEIDKMKATEVSTPLIKFIVDANITELQEAIKILEVAK